MTYYKNKKTKGAAIAFALLLGWVGGHKFYLREAGLGVLYLVFSMTLIPAVVAIVEAIYYIALDQEDFDRKYNPHLFDNPRENMNINITNSN
jgi:TM2 domain-containing membrane protein YozV